MSRASRERRRRERSKRHSASTSAIGWLVNHEPAVARLYAGAVLVAIIETLALGQDGYRTVAILMTIGMMPAGFVGVWVMTTLHIRLNPIWVPAVTRAFMSFVMLMAPVIALAAIVLYPTYPRELLSVGNGAVTGAAGSAWAAQYLYQSHGLGRRVSLKRFWSGLWREHPNPAP